MFKLDHDKGVKISLFIFAWFVAPMHFDFIALSRNFHQKRERERERERERSTKNAPLLLPSWNRFHNLHQLSLWCATALFVNVLMLLLALV